MSGAPRHDLKPLLKPRTAFSFYFEKVKDKLEGDVLKEMSSEKVPDDGKIDPRSVFLPAGYATIMEGMMGEPCAVSEESAKQCRAYLSEHRKLPRHKIPKVGMRADGMVAIRMCAARQAKMEREEEKILSSTFLKNNLDREVQSRAAKAWKEECLFDSQMKREVDLLACEDLKRVQEEMRSYYTKVHCECAQRKECKGISCICACYFCNVDRVHAKAGNRCKCSKPHREAKRWCGGTIAALAPKIVNNSDTKIDDVYASFSLDIDTVSDSATLKDTNKQLTDATTLQEATKSEKFEFMDTTNHREQPSRTCWCEERRLCQVIGCDCFCTYCLKYKAKLVNESEATDSIYCPCWNSDVCNDAETCPCACYKCATEKTLMGYCPFQPPIGLH